MLPGSLHEREEGRNDKWRERKRDAYIHDGWLERQIDDGRINRWTDGWVEIGR